MRVISYLEEQSIDQLIAESTQYQSLKAGNVGGELLNWIAMLGAIGDHKPSYVAPQLQNGHPTQSGDGTEPCDHSVPEANDQNMG